MTHDEMIAIIQAHKDGKTIQVKCRGEQDHLPWSTLWPDPRFDFGKYIYRIKPEPREVWVNTYPDGLIYTYKDKDIASINRKEGGKTIRFVEDMSYVHSD